VGCGRQSRIARADIELFLWQKVNGDWICKGDFYVHGSFATGKLTGPPPSNDNH